MTSADIANSSEVQNRRWIWNQSLFCRLWLRFPTPWTLKGRLVHVRTGKQERKARRKEEKKEGKKCASAGSCYVAPLYGDHTGSRATEWLTEFNQRGHTCLIDASIYMMEDRSSSGMSDNCKAMSRQKVVFWNTSWPTCINTCKILCRAWACGQTNGNQAWLLGWQCSFSHLKAETGSSEWLDTQCFVWAVRQSVQLWLASGVERRCYEDNGCFATG